MSTVDKHVETGGELFDTGRTNSNAERFTELARADRVKLIGGDQSQFDERARHRSTRDPRSSTDCDAQELLGYFRNLAPAGAPMLVNLNGMVTANALALSTFASKFQISALALVGPSPVDHTIASFFAKVHNPPYSTRYFKKAEEASCWLSSLSEMAVVDPGLSDI